MALSGECVAGKYRLVCPLGEGGMGSVWKALHMQLDSFVAVKLQHAPRSDAKRATARFRREARAAARITDPNVVRIVDFGIDADTPYLVMEYLVGESLKVRLDRSPRVGVEEALGIAQQAASALDAVHAAGIVHRDLKPSNLFLTQDGTTEILKLIDFGIAKWTDESEVGNGLTTDTGLVVGSVQYMSPEQARGERLDSRSDIWSLGVVVYQMLTGTLPFQGANVPDTLRQICFGDFHEPSAWFGKGSEALDAVFQRAFARQLELRFATAREFARELVAAGRGLSPPNETPSSVPQSGGWAFGREGSTRTVAAAKVPARRAPKTKSALVAVSAVLALLSGSQLLPSRQPAPAVPTTHLAPAIKLAPPPLALEEEPAALRVVEPLPAADAATVAAPRVRRTATRPLPAAPAESALSRSAPSRIDPVFGLVVPRTAAGDGRVSAPASALASE